MESTTAEKFITAYDNGKNVAEMKASLLEFSREQRDEHFYSSPIYSQLLCRFDEILSSATQSNEVGSIVTLILQYLIQSSKDSEKVRISIRDDYCFMEHLASLFNAYRNEDDDAELILECFELISRKLITFQKASYLEEMINNCFTYILNSEIEARTNGIVLQLLINLCLKNPMCVLMVTQHNDFREVWTRIRKLVDKDYIIPVTHLLYILKPAIPSAKLISGLKLVSRGIEKILETWNEPDEIEEHELSTQLMKVSQLMESILDKMKTIYESVTAEGDQSSSQKMNLLPENHKIISDTNAIILEKLTSINNFIKTDFMWSSSIIHELLELILKFFPDCTKRMLPSDFYMLAFEIIDGIVAQSASDVSLFTRCLQVFHYVAQHSSGLDSTKKNEQGSQLGQILNRIELLLENSSEAIEYNINCLQLMSYLAEIPSTSDLVSDKLNGGTVDGLLDILSDEDESLPPKIQLNRSVCVVELLNLLSKYSKQPQFSNLIKKLMSSQATYGHISNCIINAPEEIVEKALHIIALVGAKEKKASVGVAKVLVNKRDRLLCGRDDHPVVPLPHRANYVNGATHFNETLKAIGDFEETRNDNKSSNGDVENPVCQRNKTMAHLKYLLSTIERQTESSKKNQTCEIIKLVVNSLETNSSIENVQMMQLIDEQVLPKVCQLVNSLDQEGFNDLQTLLFTSAMECKHFFVLEFLADIYSFICKIAPVSVMREYMNCFSKESLPLKIKVFILPAITRSVDPKMCTIRTNSSFICRFELINSKCRTKRLETEDYQFIENFWTGLATAEFRKGEWETIIAICLRMRYTAHKMDNKLTSIILGTLRKLLSKCIYSQLAAVTALQILRYIEGKSDEIVFRILRLYVKGESDDYVLSLLKYFLERADAVINLKNYESDSKLDLITSIEESINKISFLGDVNCEDKVKIRNIICSLQKII